jgi:hypothetical protein
MLLRRFGREHLRQKRISARGCRELLVFNISHFDRLSGKVTRALFKNRKVFPNCQEICQFSTILRFNIYGCNPHFGQIVDVGYLYVTNADISININ